MKGICGETEIGVNQGVFACRKRKGVETVDVGGCARTGSKIENAYTNKFFSRNAIADAATYRKFILRIGLGPSKHGQKRD